MAWPNKTAITRGVVDMLRVNMELKTGEKLLVLSDIPRPEDWQNSNPAWLQNMLERAMLARLAAEIAAEHFTGCPVQFLPFSSTGGHGREPDKLAAAQMRLADVVVALTSYSLSHTNARQSATKAGARVASMPGFEAAMFEEGGPMAVNYRQVAADCRALADLLSEAQEVAVRTAYGTDLRFSLAGRPGQADDGLYGKPGQWGNLPAGEAFAIPLEGTGQGQLVAPAGWYPNLDKDLTFVIEKGVVVKVSGGGVVGDEFRRLLNPDSDEPLYRARRNLAELGIGANPNARKPDNVLEAEKILGSVHIAVGDNIHMGGRVEADLHEDFVQPEADLLLDGKAVIVGGKWQF